MTSRWSTMPTSFDWAVVEDILVIRALPGNISEEAWDAMLAVLSEPHIRIVYALSFGAQGVSAAQRKATAEVMAQRDTPAIVVVESRVTRGILTAISWLGANIQSFPWTRSEDALARVGASPEALELIRDVTEKFRVIGQPPDGPQ